MAAKAIQQVAPGKNVPGDQIISYGPNVRLAKTSKRQYLLPDPLPKIEHPLDINEYREFIINILTIRGGLKRSEAVYYTNDMSLFIRAVTHDSINPTDLSDNYEMLEHLGDETVNKTTTWYLKNRFPEIVKRGDPGVKILSLQRSILKSKEMLASYSERIKLTDFIQYRKLQFEYIKESGEVRLGKGKTRELKTVVMDRSMREDTFEAFFAAIESTIDNAEKMIGIGYSVAYKVLSSIFDEQNISTHEYDLVDFKTQLKELFDRRRSWNDSEVYSKTTLENPNITLTITLNVPPAGTNSRVTRPIVKVFGPMTTVMKTGDEEEFETNKAHIHQKLAKMALDWLQSQYGDEFIRYRSGN